MEQRSCQEYQNRLTEIHLSGIIPSHAQLAVIKIFSGRLLNSSKFYQQRFGKSITMNLFYSGCIDLTHFVPK
jgi:hypothetical protein